MLISIHCQFKIIFPNFKNRAKFDKIFTPFGEGTNPILKWIDSKKIKS